MKQVILARLVSLVLVFTLFLFSAQAFAMITLVDTTIFTSTGTDPSEDYDSHNTFWGSNVRWLFAIGDWVSWTHHFSFDPPAEEILSGNLAITFYDDDPSDKCLKKEYAIGWGEDHSWDFGEIDDGAYEYSLDVQYLEDGAYKVTVVSLWGDFGISRSDLEINYTPDSDINYTTIPEPSSMMLLGAGLLGAGIIRRKKR